MLIRPLLVAWLITIILGIGGGTAEAAVCSVPPYPTIQDAVIASGCSTINVAPGTYPENVMIARPLTLRGAQAGNPVGAKRFPSIGAGLFLAFV